MIRTTQLRKIRRFGEYIRLTTWERDVLGRGIRKESRLNKLSQQIPWGGMAMFAFMFIFFGVDLTAGVKYTATQLQDKKFDAKNSVELKQFEAKRWSVEQVKNYRDGEMPSPDRDDEKVAVKA